MYLPKFFHFPLSKHLSIIFWNAGRIRIMKSFSNKEIQMKSSIFKRRNLISELYDNKVKNYEYDTCNINIDNDNVIQKKEISNIMEERYGKNHSRMKKI